MTSTVYFNGLNPLMRTSLFSVHSCGWVCQHGTWPPAEPTSKVVQ